MQLPIWRPRGVERTDTEEKNECNAVAAACQPRSMSVPKLYNCSVMGIATSVMTSVRPPQFRLLGLTDSVGVLCNNFLNGMERLENRMFP